MRDLCSRILKTSIWASQINCRLLSSKSRRNSIPDWPSSSHYDDLINVAGRERDFATVRRLLNKRMVDGFFNTTDTFKFIFNDLSVLTDLTESLSHLDAGLTRKHSFDSLILALSRVRRTDEALLVADEMLKRRYGANAVTFHPILNTLAKKKQLKEAWRVVDLMRENDIHMDITGYNYILTAYCCAGDMKSATDLLERMEEEEKLQADSRTYDALVLGACKVGKVEGALMVMRRMEEDGEKAILFSTHGHVIWGMLRVGCFEQAIEFVMSYAGRDKALDTQSFGSLASRLIGFRKFQQARLVLMEMEKRDLPMGDKLREFYYSQETTTS
ncbi:pentatricopeptide repeat-containing protein At3g56030, mitochondrial [Impatiens glandulifera]|uniref:pentatricopeptide repeat-containing protein At3g56030, mitochondrial n=1 Tax=Impatiens glandulifera TaxID=253017 RepID=UPI001FB1663F|nr:pentatricopeptide repeat-containing protein At3g56030, mitochondrial [Impatiens glandulifera]